MAARFDALEAAERQKRVQAALLALPVELREVVVLRHFAGLAYDEIGETVGVPAKTVKSRLYRGEAAARRAAARMGRTSMIDPEHEDLLQRRLDKTLDRVSAARLARLIAENPAVRLRAAEIDALARLLDEAEAADTQASDADHPILGPLHERTRPSRPAVIRHNHETGGIIMARKVMLGIAAAAIVVLGVFALTGYPTVDRDTEGAIGQAKRAQAQQMAAKDVVLGDTKAQEFMQSDVFDKLMKDENARQMLSDASMRAELSNPALRAGLADRSLAQALKSAEARAAFADRDLRMAFADADVQAALGDSAFRLALADRGAAKKLTDAGAQRALANAALQAALAKSNIQAALSSVEMQAALSSAAVRQALQSADIRARLAEANVQAALAGDALQGALRSANFEAALKSSLFEAALRGR